VKPHLLPRNSTQMEKGSKAPELFLGLIGTVGAALEFLCTVLKESLAQVHYSCDIIHMIE
jgi:hypothetical protein